MEDVKWLIKKWGLLTLVVLLVTIAGLLYWDTLHTKNRKIAEEVWEPPVEIESSTAAEADGNTETST